MKIFITGASGFVGGAIAKSLSAEHDVRAMSRSEPSDARIREVGAEPVRCELGSVKEQHLRGSEALIHCAAFVGEWGSREQYWRVNVEGTEQLLSAAQEASLRRFIYLGTEAALFRGQDMVQIDETYPYPDSTPFLYSETKAEAERRVLAANEPDFETLSVRPRMVWGPGDRTILPNIQDRAEAGQFMWIDEGRARTSTTHIDNLVHGVELALERGRGGEVYFITDGTTATLRDFLTKLLQTQGVTLPDTSIPGWLARSLAFASEGAWRLMGLNSDPPLTRLAVEIMARDCTIRIDKARRELDYEPVVTREEGLEAMSTEI